MYLWCTLLDSLRIHLGCSWQTVYISEQIHWIWAHRNKKTNDGQHWAFSYFSFCRTQWLTLPIPHMQVAQVTKYLPGGNITTAPTSWGTAARAMPDFWCTLYCAIQRPPHFVVQKLGMTEGLRLEGTSGGHLLQPLCSGRDTQSWLPRTVSG